MARTGTTVTYRSRPLAERALLTAPGQPVHRHISRIGGELTREAKKVAGERVKNRTGAYLSGFKSTVALGPLGPRAKLTNNARHAVWLEAGTRPHIIVPVRARRLRFEVGGRVVFAKRVNHPGTKPYRILDTALRRVLARYR